LKRHLVIILALLLCHLPLPTVGHTQGEPFYRGKQLKIIVGFTAGGIVDLWARLIAQHIGKHIPGKPDVIVQNMPGGGSMVAANYLYGVAKPDGLTLAMVSTALFFEQLLNRPEVKFDWVKFSWIGSPVKNFETLSVRSDTPFKTIEDARNAKEPPRCGSTGTANTGHYFPQFLEEALGVKFKMILGYQGTRDIELALERGEVNCYAVTREVFEREPARSWLKNRFLRVLVQGGQKRDPSFADVPTIHELMDKYKTPEPTRRLAVVLFSPTAFGRPLLAPPGLPSDRLKTLREAYAKMLTDPEFLAETKKRDWDVERISGEELQSLANKAISQNPETIQRLKKVLTE
jgi:tripartite-type tricarboxylate transporter receptor subunit TctC